jgi:catalase
VNVTAIGGLERGVGRAPSLHDARASMANKKKAVSAKRSRSTPKPAAAAGVTTSARSTVSGPSKKDAARPSDAATAKMDASQALAAAFPFNENKAGEHGEAARDPKPGKAVKVPDARATGSTLTESIASPKAGSGKPNLGMNPGTLPIDRVRVDSSGQRMTTNLGVPVAVNQNSL